MLGEKPVLSASLIELARWMATYYCCPIETVMRSLLPQVIRKAEVGWKKQLFVRPARARTGTTRSRNCGKRAPRQAELLEAIVQLNRARRRPPIFLRKPRSTTPPSAHS